MTTNTRKRFKIGDKVSIRETQITGTQKRPSVYSYGAITKRTIDLPQLPLHGGFHYVLIDGTTTLRLVHVTRLHHLDTEVA